MAINRNTFGADLSDEANLSRDKRGTDEVEHVRTSQSSHDLHFPVNTSIQIVR